MRVELRVHFEDTHLIVLSKPAGLLSQGDESGEPSLVDHLRTRFGRHYVGLVHRLDRNTSGLMVIAKRSKAADRLSEALRSGTLRRAYLAIVEGRISAPALWRDYLWKDEARNEVHVVSAERAGAKAAALRCAPCFAFDRAGEALTLALFELETGRGHQIRAQALAHGHAIVGDRKYGGKTARAADRPLLHSAFLEFPHPMTKETLRFADALPDDFSAVLGRVYDTSTITPFK